MVRDEGAHGWSPSLLATLADIFATFVPGTEADAPRRARLAAETLDATADHDELRLLKLAIGSLENAAVCFITSGQATGFAKLDRAGRERLLLAWSTHPVGRVRTAFQALHRLGCFLAFADDGGTQPPSNPLWERIGYEIASDEPVAEPRLTPIPVDGEADAVGLEADVAIVGSGAGGGLVAARLAEAGLRVLVVEAGPYRAERDMPRAEGAAFRDLYLDRGTTSTADLGITILAGSALGGGTTINWTTSLAPPDWLRAEWAQQHALAGFDGLETDRDLDRLSIELDLQPPSVVPAKDRLILEGAAALGWEAAPTQRNAGPCTDCGACGFGCRRGAKRSGLRAHLARAHEAGAQLLVDAPAERVLVAHGRVVGVEGRIHGVEGRHPRPYRVSAPVVVMAAGALRTPLLLERSGVRHPALGRHLRLHPVAAVVGFMDEPVDVWLGPTQAARSLQFWRGGDDHGGFVIESAPPHPGLLASALPWQGGDAELELMGEARHAAPLIAIVRDAGSGRVRWSRGGHPRIEYRVDGRDGVTARRAMIEMARMARAGGARRIMAVATPPVWWHEDDGDAGFEAFGQRVAGLSVAPNRMSFFSAHQMGTARAGADARSHPCDPEGRVRMDGSGSLGAGLYVADASLFPTASGVNPMLTVMAVAERTARAVLADRD